MKKLGISLLFLLQGLYISAQDFIFQELNGIKPPEWYYWIDWTHPNYFEIVNKIDSFHYSPEGIKEDIEREAREKESGIEEELNPYEMELVRWYINHQQYIQNDGSIIENKESYKQDIQNTLLKSQNSNNPNNQNKTTAAGNWSVMGPNQNYKRGVPEMNMANVYEIAISPSQPSVLYCGTETGAFFKSSNKGVSWVSVGDNIEEGAASAIAIEPTNSNEVYWAQQTGVVYRSINGGTSWTLLANWPTGVIINKLIYVNSTRLMAAGSNGKVYYSDNKGDTWTTSIGISNTTQIWDIATRPGNNGTVYAVTTNPTNLTLKVYKSTNFGVSFTQVVTPSTFTGKVCRMTVTPANPDEVFILSLGQGNATDTNYLSPKLYYSSNSGTSFSIKCEFDGLGQSSNKGLPNGQGYYDLDIGVSPTNSNQIIVATTTAWKSTDGGLTWFPLGGFYGTHNNIHPDIQSIRSNGSDSYITTDGGIVMSSDFFTLQANSVLRNQGLTAMSFWAFDQAWKNDLIVGGRYHVENASIYDGYSNPNGCISIGGNESPAGDIIELIRDTKLQGIFSNVGWVHIPNQIQNGLDYSYTPYYNSLYPSKYGFGVYNAGFMQHPYYVNTFYLGNQKDFWRSEDVGYNYTKLASFNSNVLSFDISRTNPNIIILSTASSGLYKSVNGGLSFSPLSLPSGVTYTGPYVDVAIDPENENTIWFSQGLGAIGSRIFKSVNQGSTWTNMGDGGPVDSLTIKYINIQGGTNGGIYVTGADGRTYYRDNTMSNWLDFNNNMIANFNCRNGAQIFYSKNKLRLSGNRGIMESNLYSNSLPVALPVTEERQINCPLDTVYFTDFSIAEYNGLVYQWSFPGATWVSSITSPNPKVLYPPGTFSVTLKITDIHGKISTRTVNSMVSVLNNCAADTIAGKMLDVISNTQSMTDIGPTNINSNNFSISFWVKPHGLQKSLSQILAIDGIPGSSTTGFGIGFSYQNNNPNLVVCYTDSIVKYFNSSGLALDSTRWNNVVFTYSPTVVKIYVDGRPATLYSGNLPKLDFTQQSFFINYDLHGLGGNFKGWLDEVKFYNYTLSQNEVREKMHLIPSIPANEIGLKKYIQFNNYKSSTNSVSDGITGQRYFIAGGSSKILNSSAPVATGNVSRINIVSSGTSVFPNPNFEITWPSGATVPNGEVVGFQLYSNPDQMPNALNNAIPQRYYIINNYGTNQIVTNPSSFKINGLNLNPNNFVAGQYSLFKRRSGDYGNTWNTPLSTPISYATSLNGNGFLNFSGAGITSFSQFVVGTSASSTSLNIKEYSVLSCNKNAGLVRLSWISNDTSNYNLFEILRSTNSVDYDLISTVSAVSGKTDYTFLDYLPESEKEMPHFYRVRAIDHLGDTSFAKLVYIDCDSNSNTITLWPNPASDVLYFHLGYQYNDAISASILDLKGRIIKSFEVKGSQSIFSVDISELADDIYYLQVQRPNELTTIHRFMKIGH